MSLSQEVKDAAKQVVPQYNRDEQIKAALTRFTPTPKTSSPFIAKCFYFGRKEAIMFAQKISKDPEFLKLEKAAFESGESDPASPAQKKLSNFIFTEIEKAGFGDEMTIRIAMALETTSPYEARYEVSNMLPHSMVIPLDTKSDRKFTKGTHLE